MKVTADAARRFLVARHFLECRLRHFAFVGCAAYDYSADREKSFRRALAAAGHPLASYQVSPEMTLASRSRTASLGSQPW